MSLGLLSLIPLLGLGLKTARHARNDRASEQIAQTMVEEAKLGTLSSGTTVYLDDQMATCAAGHAAFTAQATIQSLPASLSQLTLRITPVGSPDRARVYAVVFPSK